MIGRYQEEGTRVGAHGKGAQLNKGVCIMPCHRTFIMADWIPKPSACRPAVVYGLRLKRVGMPDLLDVLK